LLETLAPAPATMPLLSRRAAQAKPTVRLRPAAPAEVSLTRLSDGETPLQVPLAWSPFSAHQQAQPEIRCPS
jgi:hypothetical protein